MNAPALLLWWISSFLRDRTVRILGHTSREIAINDGVPQGSTISPLLFLSFYLTLIDLSLLKISWSTLNPLSLDQTSSNLTINMDDLALFNHRIILSCTKSIRVLFERKKTDSNHKTSLLTARSSLLRHLLSSLVLPLTLLSPSDRTFVHSPLLPVIAYLNWTLSSLQPMAPLPLPSPASTNPSSVHCLITVRQLHA